MRFTDFLSEQCVLPDLRARDKKGVLHALADQLSVCTHASADTLEALLVDRERLSSTAVGEGVAIPHCRIDRLRHITACVAVQREGVEFGSRDGVPVRLFVTLVSPAQGSGTHLSVLARIAALLRDARLREQLLEARTAVRIRELLVQAEDAYLAAQQARHDAALSAGAP